MKFAPAISTILALSPWLVSAKPVENEASLTRRQDDRGSHTVDGLGSRKQEIADVGGTSLDLAIAMLETENLGTDYAYGDNKVDDAANFGIFKQNWFMLRNAVPEFEGQSTADWNNGAVLNEDLAADVSARHTSQELYGYDVWFGGHRNGETGIGDPNTDDIATYRSGVEWIQEQIESDPSYLTDDTRFWVDVTPI